MIDKDLMGDAIQRWGLDLQVDLAVEECSELITALQHNKRGRGTIADVVEEIADVKIMVAQLEMMFGEQSVAKVVGEKMNRLRDRLGRGIYNE